MEIPKTEIEFRNALIDAAELGAQKALEMAGCISPMMKVTEAYRQYGRRQVERWIKERLINPKKDGENTSAVRISRVEISSVAMMANRESYYSNKIAQR